MSNVIAFYPRPPGPPDVDWASAYQAVIDALDARGCNHEAFEIYQAGPDARADDGEPVTVADYKRAFHDLDIRRKKDALIYLCDTDPALAVDVIIDWDPFGDIPPGRLHRREADLQTVIEAIKLMGREHLFDGPDWYFGIAEDLKNAISLTG